MRQGVSKTQRFDVFKRDSFTCQYCGKQAPLAILEIDHINPVAEGGDNDVMNLITSCFDCNRGKGAKKLSDHSVIEQQKKQLNEINKKREQLKMMLKWRQELGFIDDEQVGVASDAFAKIADCSLSECGRKDMLSWIKRFGLSEVLEAISISEKYIRVDGNGKIDEKTKGVAFFYIPRICTVRANQSRDPSVKDALYIRGILNNRLSYINQRAALAAIKAAISNADADPEDLKEIAKNVRNWTDFKNTMFEEYGVVA